MPSSKRVPVLISIAQGQTTSSPATPAGKTVAAIELPSTTGTSLSVQVLASDGVTWIPLYLNDQPITIPSGTARRVALEPSTFFSCESFRVVSNQAEASARTIYLHLRDV